jgi:hypothetical protein
MATTPRCENGHDVRSDARFCPQCGGRVAVAEEGTIEVPAATVPTPPRPPTPPPPTPPRRPDDISQSPRTPSQLPIRPDERYAYRGVSPAGRRRRPGTAIAIGVVTVLILGGAGGAIYALVGQHSSSAVPGHTTTSAVSRTTSTTTSLVQASLSAIESLLQQSSAARQQVTTTTNAVDGCTTSGSDGASQMNTPISTRQAIIHQLSTVPRTGLPTMLVPDLISAEQYSLQSDQSYRAWMSSIPPLTCGSEAHNADYDNGQTSSEQATTAKTQFVVEFNPLAAQYGLPSWSQDQI